MDLWAILSMPTTWLAIILAGSFYLYRKFTENFDYFAKQGIPGPKPLPLVGNMWGVWRETLPYYDQELVKKYGKTFGYFDGTVPNLWTVDEKLIKAVFVKDFDHFVNRRIFQVSTKVFRKFLTLLTDQEWKDVRSSVSPTFTTGKIKRMSVLIKECADKLSGKLEKALKENQGQFEAKTYFSSFTMDVVARCAFGMNIENLGEKDDPFMKNAAFVFNPAINQKPTILLPFVFRGLGQLVNNLVFITKEFKFFVRVLRDLVKSRENSSEVYHDFVEIANEAVKTSVKTDDAGNTVPMWRKEDAEEIVIAQSVLFLLAGFETTGTTLTNIFFMLAKYPDIQERLYNEMAEKLEQNNGEITHELVNSLPYLEQVINETLRVLPPALRIERECSRDYTYGNMTIKKGTIITIPAYVLHRLEKYYPDPERFDPERWSPENKAKIDPYVFLPFGSGPRNCIGMRFALEEIKFALFTLLNKYRIVRTPETPEDIEFLRGFNPVLIAKKFVLSVEPRE